MKKLLTLIAFICFCANANAQYVNIPDATFRGYLMQQYPSCFDTSGRMDTTCNQIISTKRLSIFLINIYGPTPGPNPTLNLDGIQYFKSVDTFSYYNGNPPFLVLENLHKLSNSVKHIYLTIYDINQFGKLPDSLISFTFDAIQIINKPISFPQNLKNLYLYHFESSAIISLPDSLKNFIISKSLSTTLPNLPDKLEYLNCSFNRLKALPKLPNSLKELNCSNNSILILPTLPDSLTKLIASINKLNYLPELPESLTHVEVDSNNIYCLPHIPYWTTVFYCDFFSKITCFPNYTYLNSGDPTSVLFICNPTNNINHCQSFPQIQSFVYNDLNKNNTQDINEYPKHNLKLTLSNNNYSYTNNKGTAYINADSLGTYTITAKAPPLYNAVPASYTHTFNSYDTIVYDTFALQPLVVKDSLSINITPINFAARPGFEYVYECSYENVGTTVVNSTINFNYDTSKLILDSTNNAAITNAGNSLQLAVNNFVPGQIASFLVYCTVKPTATLGNSLQATASIAGGNAIATDTANTTIRGSYDPNDKQATPKLSVTEVADNNHWINYTVRFQNTGNDTAFTVVVADTLDASKLQINSLQLTGLSHNCKVSQNDKIVFFEFLNINLPDSNTNKTNSNGFVSFRIKPVTTLTNGNVVPNKASIYFDYNEPVLTNTANTIIGTLPLTLTAFGAIPKAEQNKVFVYWNTANEINTSYFIIEQSENGRTFTPAAEVAAIGKGNNSYYFNIDKNKTQYLRLKVVDKNGTYTYSNIVKLSINQSTNQSITIASPAKSELKINVTATSLHNTKASLINAQGKVVKTFTLKQGYQTIDIAALQSGLYYLQTNEGIIKLIVERG